MTERFTAPITPGLYRGRDYGDGQPRLLLVIKTGPSPKGPGEYVWFERTGPGWTTPNEPDQHRTARSFRDWAAERLGEQVGQLSLFEVAA